MSNMVRSDVIRPGGEGLSSLAGFFRVFADETRILILCELSDGEKRVLDIANSLGLSHSAVSHQLQMLRAQRLGIVPVTFKLGEQEDGTPVYHTFDTTAELDGFYHQAAAYIQQCLQTGWYVKDNIDWTPYEAMFAEK